MSAIKHLINLEGRRALITGATGGLGHQMAVTLAELGADLILLDHPSSDYTQVLKSIEEISHASVELMDCDLEDGAARSNIIDILFKMPENLNILINNAAFVGTSNLEGWNTDFYEQSLDTWRRALEVNLTAVFDICKGLAVKLKNSGHASIINIGSIYGVNAPDYSLYKNTDINNPAAYAASKGGLIQLTRWLATTLAPDVRVNSISPGGVFRNQPASFVKRYEKKTPLSRMARDEDLKGVTAFLSSDLSAYITGQNIIVDGGWTI